MNCPLCGGSAKVWGSGLDQLRRTVCELCGEFAMLKDDIDDFLESPIKREKSEAWKLSCLIREHTVRNQGTEGAKRVLLIFGNLDKAKGHFGEQYEVVSKTELLYRWPKLVSMRITRSLCNLARLSERAGQAFEKDFLSPFLLFSRNLEERDFVLEALCAQGLLGKDGGITYHMRRYNQKLWMA